MTNYSVATRVLAVVRRRSIVMASTGGKNRPWVQIKSSAGLYFLIDRALSEALWEN